MAHEIAKSNGYPIRECSPRLAHRRPRLTDGSEKIPFCLPFISNELARRDGENTGRHENGQACSRRQLDIFCRVWLLMKLGYNATPMFVQF
ncbi:hypothetical protein Y032_0298g1756 [Ancylostoma ceylanicum]|uniref:Uncharacterized protein n=1 Tax=Ancylostoma ceylanicum TaxID=53326 RepID=A0A016S453_9BILA|nr:hypothetical protein Y032_0298g1756 [Ancylostoma ceylanicum]